MFGKEKNNITNISPTSYIKGNLKSEEDIIIEGKITGKVSTSGRLEIRKAAQLEANLEAERIIIAGRVKGNIKAQKLEITETGEVYGDVDSKIFSMAADAVFIGECKAGEGNKSEIKEIIKEKSFENLTDEELVEIDES